MNSHLIDIIECQDCGKHAIGGVCIYLPSVPCMYRGPEPEYACKKWLSKGLLKEQQIRQAKIDSSSDTQVD